MSFEGDTGDNYTVVAKTTSGRKSCKVPCALALSPGDLDIQVSGDSAFEKTIDVPDHSAHARIGHTGPFTGIVAGTMFVLSGVTAYFSVDELSRKGLTVSDVGLGTVSTLALAVGVIGVVLLFTRWNFIDVTVDEK